MVVVSHLFSLFKEKFQGYNLLTEGKQELIDELRVLRLLAAKEERSFLFSKELRKIIRNSKWEDEYKFIFKVLTEYAIYNLHVFSSEDTGIINANIALPFSIVSKEKDRISLLKGCLNLNSVSPIPRKFFGDIQVKMDAISLVLKEIIPGLTINLTKMQCMKNIDFCGSSFLGAKMLNFHINHFSPFLSPLLLIFYALLYCINF